MGIRGLLKEMEERLNEKLILLKVLDNVDLVKENERVEHSVSGVVNDAGKDDIFKVGEAVGLVNFDEGRLVRDGYDLNESCWVRKVSDVVGLHLGEFGIICARQRCQLKSHWQDRMEPPTFKDASNTKEKMILHDMIKDKVVVEEEEGLNNGAEGMEGVNGLQILGIRLERNQLADIVGLDDPGRNALPSHRRAGLPLERMEDIDDVVERGRRQGATLTRETVGVTAVTAVRRIELGT